MNSTIPNLPDGPIPAGRASPDLHDSDWIRPLTGVLGLVGFICAAAALPHFRLTAGEAALALSMGTALPMIVYETVRSKMGMSRDASRNLTASEPGVQRVMVKMLGLLTTAALLVAAYWLFPFFRTKPFEPFRQVGSLLLPFWLIAAVPYFFWLDSRMAQPQDGYWHLGQAVLLRHAEVNRKVLGQHFLAWTVKGFFLPLMFTALSSGVFKLHATGGLPDQFQPGFTYAIGALYTLDVAFAVAGYAFTLKALDSQVRSVEPTMLGWVSALVCYEPFWEGIGSNFVSYESSPSRGASFPWLVWLHSSPALASVWGWIILGFVAVYTASTICFGVRFSNLTHRGIVGFGPYYFTKHPAYISKLLSYAMLSIPFVPFGGVQEAFRRCLMFGLLIAIYRIRAITEERHLSADPTYVRYAMQVEARHLRWFGFIPPILGIGKRRPVIQNA